MNLQSHPPRFIAVLSQGCKFSPLRTFAIRCECVHSPLLSFDPQLRTDKPISLSSPSSPSSVLRSFVAPPNLHPLVSPRTYDAHSPPCRTLTFLLLFLSSPPFFSFPPPEFLCSFELVPLVIVWNPFPFFLFTHDLWTGHTQTTVLCFFPVSPSTNAPKAEPPSPPILFRQLFIGCHGKKSFFPPRQEFRAVVWSITPSSSENWRRVLIVAFFVSVLG